MLERSPDVSVGMIVLHWGTVRGASLVNEMLYVAGTTDCVRLRPYVIQLVENLCHLHEVQSGKVRLDFAVEEVDLAPEIAVPRPDP
jgi:two-component sensor histidine kinase